MARRSYIALWVVLLTLLVPSTSYAIFNGIRLLVESVGDKISDKMTELQSYQQMMLQMKDQVTQMSDTVQQIQGNVEEIANSDWEAIAVGQVTQMAQDVLSGKQTDDEVKKKVSKSTRRKKGADEKTMEVAAIINDAVNAMKGQAAAELYVKALMLRQDLEAEKDPDDKTDDFISAMQSSAKMMLTSARRWNKILEMQAYLNDYRATNMIVNYPREADDED